jgi:hypothetical protein
MGMHRRSSMLGLVLLTGLLGAQSAWAQDNPMATHVGHVADAFTGTPQGQGLLPTARAEADIMVRHLALAAGDVADLEAIKMHVGHALHAVDPTVVTMGPGLGYGLKRAAQEAAEHVGYVRDDDGASTRVKIYAHQVAGAALTTVDRCDEFIEKAQELREATTAEAAADLLEELTTLGNQIIHGRDANNDNGIGPRYGEGGLEQARQSLAVLKTTVAAGGGRGRAAPQQM